MFNKSDNMIDSVLTHMEDKYGEPFTYAAPWGASYAQNGVVKMLLSCNSLPEAVLVEAEKDGNGGYLIRDNYLAVKYSDTMQSTIQTMANDIFGQSIVYNEISMYGLSPALPATASFSEYYTDPETALSASVVVPAQGFDENKLQSFAEQYAALGVRASMRFVVVEDIMSPSVHDEESLDNTISTKSYRYFAFIFIENKTVKINARKGE